MSDATSDTHFWDKAARKYAASRIADMAGYERTLEHTRRHLSDSDKLLEIGCGTGTTAIRLAPSVAHILATDISSEMIAIGREKASAESCTNVTFERMTPVDTGLAGGAFDAVLGFSILHLLADRPAMYSNIKRVLKPGGLFISKTPCLAEMNPLIRLAVPAMQLFRRAPTHVAFFSAAELEREIVAAGFDIIERGYHGTKGKDVRPFLVAQ
ncbi:MAG: hypothetical protein RLZ98_3251, partial [Pseudomonadota bacterium]